MTIDELLVRRNSLKKTTSDTDTDTDTDTCSYRLSLRVAQCQLQTRTLLVELDGILQENGSLRRLLVSDSKTEK